MTLDLVSALRRMQWFQGGIVALGFAFVAFFVALLVSQPRKPFDPPPQPPPRLAPSYSFLVGSVTAAAQRVLDSRFREAAALYGSEASELQPQTYADMKEPIALEIARELTQYIDALEVLGGQNQDGVEKEFQRRFDAGPTGRDVLALGLALKHYRHLMKTGKTDRAMIDSDFRRDALG